MASTIVWGIGVLVGWRTFERGCGCAVLFVGVGSGFITADADQ
jgi:hypothetical protein